VQLLCGAVIKGAPWDGGFAHALRATMITGDCVMWLTAGSVDFRWQEWL